LLLDAEQMRGLGDFDRFAKKTVMKKSRVILFPNLGSKLLLLDESTRKIGLIINLKEKN